MITGDCIGSRILKQVTKIKGEVENSKKKTLD